MIYMIKVSILVPVYGVEQYIEKCARSLFEQTYSDIEYIFVNDCTKDDSIGVLYSVLGKYPHRKQQVRIINHEKNKGLGAARRTAILNAKGDYILHVDSDDYIANNAVEVLVKEAKASNADIVDSAYAGVDKDITVSVKLPFHGKKAIYNDLIISRLGLVGNQIWGRLIRTSLYDDEVINQEGIDFGEDYSVLPILLYKGKRSYIDDTLYYYRTDNVTSYMNSCLSKKHIESYIKANHVVYDFLSKKSLPKSTRYSLELGMINLIVFCRRNKYDYTKSHFYVKQNIDFWSLKIYRTLLIRIENIYLNLIFKALFTKKYKKLLF